MAWTKTIPAKTITADTAPAALKGTFQIDQSSGDLLCAVVIPTDLGVTGATVDVSALLSVPDLQTLKGLLGQIRDAALVQDGFTNT